ncbi:carbohydrate esterase family 12 protein [Cucurbitaria berberidis CBS 394.84]|uniref:Carbohydrate esterase family 12 protein n=1 Tax=Cucurbitaria berberidis CBS 394.84 TaxID=1168544 RepID=A0A9P4GLS8_9PLEO|nr:carbohydrate esterase family 12 protein [Cucurbitaria berberidis CBS 394.84]KAF1848713.1 carbohydrate esterase family 12 protein [Cucurbitaria berberidis CBS 394.84]
MRFTLLSLLPVALAVPATVLDRAVKPVYWLLAGDSTTAPAGGWGDAFLSTTVAKGSSGHNYGHSGASTKSFRAGGDWKKVIGDIGTHKKDYRVYVTIQFGHNDQKPTSGVSLADYKTNLGNFVNEVTAAGGIPILVTPLTRRTFNKSTKKVVENLSNERTTTIAVADEKKARFIDLNRASTDYVNAIGEKAITPYNLGGTDRTHVSPWGGVVFSRLVSDLLVAKYPGEFEEVTQKNATLSALIKAGKPA